MGDAEFRYCKWCDTLKPLTEFYRARDGRAGRASSCTRARQREREQSINSPLSVRSVNRTVVSAPDPEPARRMRTELHRLRDAGAAFPAAWDIALSYALGQLPSGERTEWRRAFDSMRPMWAEAYAGMEARPLPFLPDDEHVAA